MKNIMALLFVFLSALGYAQTKTYTATRVDSPPHIDGYLNDDCWLQVEWAGDFVQYEPQSGAAPSQQTQFAVAYDDDNLYVAIKALDTEPDKIVKRISRRDNADGDWVAICIDSYEDKMTAFEFCVSASGSKSDYLRSESTGEDESWDPIWEVKTSIANDGWHAEMRIPYSQLRFGKKTSYHWGLQVVRNIYRHQELSFWQPIDKASSQFVGKFATLEGITHISPRKDVEIVPFALSQLTLSEKEEGNPFATGKETTASVGVDGKISLSNDITLNFTVNPDFGQVEADPSEVNLTNFETYFVEKRPFFVEGSNIFHYPFDITNNEQNKLFYSRRLGREPHITYEAREGEKVKHPMRTNILGAVKISGKTRKGTSLGILNAVTQKMYSKIDFNGERSSYAVEPLSNYFVGRLEQDLDSGNTIVGGMLTATHRKIDEPQFSKIADAAYTGGLNFTKYWNDKAYFVTARSFFSHISGSRQAIATLQQSSARYFQRPDADHVQLDTTLTVLSGWGASVNGGKIAGHFNFMGFSSWSSPGLEFNDIGFKPATDYVLNGLWTAYKEWTPKGIVNEDEINGSLFVVNDFSGKITDRGLESYAFVRFKNYSHISLGSSINLNGISTTLLRGGPSIKTPGSVNSWFHISSDNRRKFQVEYNMSKQWGFENSSHSISYGLELTYKPGPQLSLSLYPQYYRSTNHQQYVQTVSGSEPVYILSSIDQHIASMSVRINLGITPDMSLQLYALPYLFAGDYYDFKEVVDPYADKFANRFRVLNSYDYPNPDFHFLQFRSNLVYRWEYKPGSVLYLVWSQGKTVKEQGGKFLFGDYVRDLYKAKPQNVFLVKLSYAIIF